MGDEEKVKCECCKKEIPKSVAKTSEGAEYVLHFCSPNCRDHFFKEHPEKKPG